MVFLYKKNHVLFPLALVGIFLIIQAVKLSIHKHFSIDEFTYAHAGWLIANGNLPYKDFFCHHFPLGYYLFSIPFIFKGHSPSNIFYLRLIMWPFFILILTSSCIINHRFLKYFSWTTGVILLSIPTIATFAIEARPDLMALSTFLLALCGCTTKFNQSFWQSFMIGILIGISICFSEKVICYGSIFLIGFLIDFFHNSKKNLGYMGGSPKSLAAGLLVIGGLSLLFLTATNSFDDWLTHSLDFTLTYQRDHKGFSSQIFLWPSLLEIIWLVPFALLGTLYTLYKWIKSGEQRWRDPELMLLLALPSTFLSYAIQKQAYPYSLVPFFSFMAIFSIRGIWLLITTIDKTSDLVKFLANPIILAALFIFFYHSVDGLSGRIKHDNQNQINVLTWIETNTEITDAIYDNSGSYVSRPHASFYYFTNDFTRTKNFRSSTYDLISDIRNSGATVFLRDSRYDYLDCDIKKYIDKTFFPLNNDIWIWGKKFGSNDLNYGHGSIHINKDGNYFIFPEQLLKDGELYIDKIKIDSSIVILKKGPHSIKYNGSCDELYILWLPKNERPFIPTISTKTTFSSTL